MFKVPFVVVLKLSWYKSYGIRPRPGQFWCQNLEPALRHLNNLREHRTQCISEILNLLDYLSDCFIIRSLNQSLKKSQLSVS